MKKLALGMTMFAIAFSLTTYANDAAKSVEGAKKVSYKEAKEQCLKENASLVGKELHKCIKNAKQKTM